MINAVHQAGYIFTACGGVHQAGYIFTACGGVRCSTHFPRYSLHAVV